MSLWRRVTSWFGAAPPGRGKGTGFFFFFFFLSARALPCPLDPPASLTPHPPSSTTITHREAGDPAKAKSYLPPNKQYLVTRNGANVVGEEGHVRVERAREARKVLGSLFFSLPFQTVPSRRRAAVVEQYGGDASEMVLEGDGEDGGWVAPPAEGALGRGAGGGQRGGGGGSEDQSRGAPPPLLNEDGGEAAAAVAPPAASPEEEEDPTSSPASSIPDLDDLEIVEHAEAAEADPAALVAPPKAGRGRGGGVASTAAATAGTGSIDGGGPGDAAGDDGGGDDPHLLRTRTYDLMMTYDKYYQTPRVWLAGYGPDRAPLSSGALLADVAAEHARKTVTWDPFPHGPGRAASIHPCRHAAVMKKLASISISSGAGGGPLGGGGGGAGGAGGALPVDRYLVLFLKFIQAVIPTIEYDFTMAAATVGRA